jgi:hypothetical protein
MAMTAHSVQRPGYGLDSLGSISAISSDFYLSRCVQHSCGTHPASYAMDTRVTFTGVKRSGREADHSSPSSAEVRDVGAIPPPPLDFMT